MLANINVTIRIDDELKGRADELFESLGMSFTTAVNVFIRQSLREGAIPFRISQSKNLSAHADYAVLDADKIGESKTNND